MITEKFATCPHCGSNLLEIEKMYFEPDSIDTIYVEVKCNNPSCHYKYTWYYYVDKCSRDCTVYQHERSMDEFIGGEL
jgi:hypothetical protein